MAKVLVAMSGGVDSSVTALLLKQAGHECVGVTMRLVDCNNATRDAHDAKVICDKLGMDHYVLEETREFDEKVVKQFVQQYEQGLTPNPCIFCNKNFKFGRLIQAADELGCDFMATGHYAQVIRDEAGIAHVKRASNPKKDQSYVLWPVKQEILKRVMLPLGTMESKEHVRAIAAENGFANAQKSDSQDICFIQNGHYPEFLKNYTGQDPKPGPIVDEFGETIGEHKGLTSYTLGQRKGVGVAAKRKIYVTGKDAKTNTLFVGSDELLYAHEFYASETNWSSGVIPTEPVRAKICATYQGRLFDCVIYPMENDRARIVTDVAMRAVCPGQSCVAYVDDEVIFGGFIDEPEQQIRTALQEVDLSDPLGIGDLLKD